MDCSGAECQSFNLVCRFSFLVLLLEEIKKKKRKKEKYFFQKLGRLK